MTMDQLMLIAAIASLGVTALVHSIGGEIYLLRPIFALRGNAVLDHWLARRVLRFAWHLTALMWALIAAVLWLAETGQTGTQGRTAILIGAGFLIAGIFDLFYSRGRHIGWPLLVAVGAFAMAAGVIR